MLDWFYAMVPSLTSPTFTAVVNVISIIGFLITIFVMIGVRQIKGQYTSRIRVPELRSKIKKCASEIGQLLNDFQGNKHQIPLELNMVEPVLVALKKRLRWNDRAKIRMPSRK